MRTIIVFLLLSGSAFANPDPAKGEAAALLAHCAACASNAGTLPERTPPGPVVASTWAEPGSLTWLPWPSPSPRIRLDGSLLSDPPAVYGPRIILRHYAKTPPFRGPIPRPGISGSGTRVSETRPKS